MNYNMLENEIIKLQDEEFGLQMLGDVTVILAKARDIYLSDFKRRLDTKDKYDYIVSLVINLLQLFDLFMTFTAIFLFIFGLIPSSSFTFLFKALFLILFE